MWSLPRREVLSPLPRLPPEGGRFAHEQLAEATDGVCQDQLQAQELAYHFFRKDKDCMMRYLRNKKDGFIYEWDAILAKNPLCEEVTEEEAYPERFVKPEAVEKAKRTRRRTKKTLDLETKDVPEEPVYTMAELAEEAKRGWPE